MDYGNLKIITLAVLSILFTTCISPLNLDPGEPDDDILVINGFITDSPGQYEIVLSRVTKFAGTQTAEERFDKQAEVFITDQNGVRTDFNVLQLDRRVIDNPCAVQPNGGCCPQELILRVESLGFNSPPDFSGEVGNTYILTVITFNGRVYQSTPQTILPGPELDSVFYEYKQLPSSDNVTFDSGIEIFSTWEDPPETENYYAWQLNGTYKIISTPDPNPLACCLRVPGDAMANVCYVNERNVIGNRLAFSDLGVNGQVLTESAGFIQDDGFRFADVSVPPSKQYYVEVEQFSMSQETFQFNQLLSSQLDIDGDIFDPPPAEIRGNMRNVNDPDEVVIGFFATYSVQKAGVFVNRGDLEFIQRFSGECNDCRTRAGASNEIPEVYR